MIVAGMLVEHPSWPPPDKNGPEYRQRGYVTSVMPNPWHVRVRLEWWDRDVTCFVDSLEPQEASAHVAAWRAEERLKAVERKAEKALDEEFKLT